MLLGDQSSFQIEDVVQVNFIFNNQFEEINLEFLDGCIKKKLEDFKI